ncbi:MAG TPA: hypothetical protein EYG93_11015 [Sulfurospirillum arcachonense]|nr:hypothetical protein [Sulfurospirillum arcachonense]HIP45830.1 hypothetical protein [Sulfurospirillum arcachonense]
MIKFLTTVVALFVLVGCSSKEVKPYEIYSIHDNTKVEQALHVDKVLKIVKIKSPKQMHSDKIWYKESSFKIDSYFYSKWNTSFTDMIEQNLVNSISRSNLFKAAYSRHSKVRADFVLESELIDSVHDVASNVVSFGIRLYVVEGTVLKSSKEFEYEEKCTSKNAKGAVKAYEKIIKKLNKDVILWLSKSVKED